MNGTCPQSWIFVAAFATAACAGRYQVGVEPGSGGASGATGSQVATGPAATSTSSVSTGAGGAATTGTGSTTTGAGGQGGSNSRCGFTPDEVVSEAPAASAMTILLRIGRFLDDSSSVPPGMLPINPTPEWARVQAMTILDGHLSTGTEALGLSRFLSGWLKAPTFDAGLSAPHVWSTRLLDPNATLATLLAGPTSDPRRSGVLTDQQLLAARPTISTRGTWMSANLWCSLIPAPPPNIPPGGPKIPGATRRQQLEADTNMPLCRSCHAMMDPQGYALEHFDELGNYRDVDNGQPVDASGTIQPLAISFNGIDDLAPQLSESCLVAQCFTRLLMSDAFGVESWMSNLPFTENEVNHVANVFANSGFSIRTLVGAIVTTPSFLR